MASNVIRTFVSVNGRTVSVEDLSHDARDLLRSVDIKHGPDELRWPAAVRDEIQETLRASLLVRNEVAAETRLGVLRNRVEDCAARTLQVHGPDPRAWPDAALDDIAQAEAKLAAFERLVLAAQRIDPNWRTHKVLK